MGGLCIHGHIHLSHVVTHTCCLVLVQATPDTSSALMLAHWMGLTWEPVYNETNDGYCFKQALHSDLSRHIPKQFIHIVNPANLLLTWTEKNETRLHIGHFGKLVMLNIFEC